MGHWVYALAGLDPVGSGDATSWFSFYKKDAGVTCVCVCDGPPLPREGDGIWFHIDDVLQGHATVIKVDYNMQTGGHDVYYDSDRIVKGQEAPEGAMPVRAWRAR